MVLIDAAKGCATEPPDLSKYKADFVVVSFYKVISTSECCLSLDITSVALFKLVMSGIQYLFFS